MKTMCGVDFYNNLSLRLDCFMIMAPLGDFGIRMLAWGDMSLNKLFRGQEIDSKLRYCVGK